MHGSEIILLLRYWTGEISNLIGYQDSAFWFGAMELVITHRFFFLPGILQFRPLFPIVIFKVILMKYWNQRIANA